MQTARTWAFSVTVSALAAGLISSPAWCQSEEPHHSSEPGLSGLLLNRCRRAARSDLSDEDFYAVCIDAFPDAEGVVTLECHGGKDEHGAPPCKRAGDAVRVLRSFVVYVWHPAGTRAKVALAGAPGQASSVYVPGGMEKLGPAAFAAAGPEETPRSVWTFGPRKRGAAALSVTILSPPGEGEPVKELLKVEQTYAVEAFYRAAVRLGIGLSWMPWARRVGRRSTGDGQKHAEVIEGADQGLFSAELVAGASYFFCEMPEHALKVCAAAGIRLGLLGSEGGELKTMRSLMIGPELAIGPDFALGIFGGIQRHDVPAVGFEPGTSLPSSTLAIPTQLGLTPAFGVVVNFTPGFLSGAGLVK
jgi:hypothetical protein